MKNLIKKVATYALPFVLAASPLNSQHNKSSDANTQSSSLENIVEKNFTHSELGEKEFKEALKKVSNIYELQGVKILDPKIKKLVSKQNSNGKIYLAELDFDRFPRVNYSGLAFKDGTIFLIENGINEEYTKVLGILEAPSEKDDNYDPNEEVLFRKLTRKAFLKKPTYEEFKGDINNKGFLRETKFEEEIGAYDYQNKKDISDEESEERQNCIRIINGNSKFNVARIYRYAGYGEENNPYRLSKRFISYLESKGSPLDMTDKQLKDVAKEYLRKYYKDANFLIENFK